MVLLAILGISIITNPGPKAHLEGIKDSLVKISIEEQRREGKTGTSNAAFTSWIVGGLVSAVSDLISTSNYVVFSVSYFRAEDKNGKLQSKPITIGLLGQVFCLFGKKDVESAFKN